MAKIQLYNGDCFEIMKDIPDKSIDMILCDLPYGITQCKWDITIPFQPLWEQYKRIIKENGAILLFSSQPFTSALVMSNIKMFKYEWIWQKTHPKGHLNAKKMPMRAHENIEVFYNKPPTYNPQMTHNHKRKIANTNYIRESNGDSCYGKETRATFYDSTDRYPLDVQVFSNADQTNKLHPTQKPVALLEYLIKTYTNEGETILDNCMGSGSTGVAAINTNRNFIGIELDEKYYEIANERINEANHIKWGGGKGMKNGTISLFMILQIVFVILKLCGVITWSWWIVLIPLYLDILIFIITTIIQIVIINKIRRL